MGAGKGRRGRGDSLVGEMVSYHPYSSVSPMAVMKKFSPILPLYSTVVDVH